LRGEKGGRKGDLIYRKNHLFGRGTRAGSLLEGGGQSSPSAEETVFFRKNVNAAGKGRARVQENLCLALKSYLDLKGGTSRTRKKEGSPVNNRKDFLGRSLTSAEKGLAF